MDHDAVRDPCAAEPDLGIPILSRVGALLAESRVPAHAENEPQRWLSSAT